MLGVQYLSDGRIRFLFDHWGAPICVSEPLLVHRAETQLLEPTFDALSGRMTVKLNGRTAMACATGVFPAELQKPILGKNTIRFTTVGPSFSGSLYAMTLQRDGEQ